MSVCVGVSLEIVDGQVITYNLDGGEMFCHSVRSIRHMAITKDTNKDITKATAKEGLFYVTKESGLGEVKRYKCYLFHLESASQVSIMCRKHLLGGLPALECM